MPLLTLVNPGRKVSRRKGKSTKRRSTRSRRAKNPVSVASVKRVARRRSARRGGAVGARRRRRNPITGRALSQSWGKLFKQVAVGGVGAVGVDMAWAFVNKYLPASLQPSLTGPGLNDALKMAATVVLGKAASKATKGLSEQAAIGALIVQVSRLAAPMVAKVMPQAASTVAGLGYTTASRVVPGNMRLGPLQRGRSNMGLFQQGSPMLGLIQQGSPMMRMTGGSARAREGAVR